MVLVGQEDKQSDQRLVRKRRLRRLSRLSLIGRIAAASAFAALVASLTILAKPLWQSERTPLNADSPTSQPSKSSDRLAATNAPANNTRFPAAGIAVAPGAAPSAGTTESPASLNDFRRIRADRWPPSDGYGDAGKRWCGAEASLPAESRSISALTQHAGPASLKLKRIAQVGSLTCASLKKRLWRE
jgi:hypothetical protein